MSKPSSQDLIDRMAERMGRTRRFVAKHRRINERQARVLASLNKPGRR